MKQNGLLVVVGGVCLVVVVAVVMVQNRGIRGHKEGPQPGPVAEPTAAAASTGAEQPAEARVGRSARGSEPLGYRPVHVPAVSTVSGETDKRNYIARSKAVESLGRDLTEDEVGDLFAVLKDKDDAFRGELDRLEYESLRNNILGKLLGQDELPAGVGALLVSVVRDKEHNATWRDYCVQHLSAYYLRKWGQLTGDAAQGDPERGEIEQVFWGATKETEGTIAGTALLGLDYLSRTRPELDKTRIANTAVSLATSDTCSEATRIAAMRIACNCKRSEVIGSARMLAQSGETVPLQVAGIAALADIGDESDLEYLETVLASDTKALRPAAERAYRLLSQRVGSN